MPIPSLLPQPMTLDPVPGAEVFPLRAGISIVVAHGAERGEWLAAEDVRAAIRTRGVEAPIQPQLHCPDTQNTIVLAVRRRDEAIFPDAAPPSDWAAGDSPEAYALTIDGDRVVLWGAGPAGLVQGTRTLRQLIAGAANGLPAARITDAPALAWRGVMLDISRGRVPTLETLYRIVDVISSYKINMLQLYTEHTFAFRRHPKIGQGWGAITPEELMALDTYCHDRYVDLVPCLQSFGHMRKILELPEYAHLAESDQLWGLAPTEPGTYELLDDLYADYLACFRSRYFNVCSDETYDLGTGKSQAAAELEGNGRLYLGHILRLHELATKYGRTMMVWDDIFLHYPELVAEIPKDAILLNWAYEAQDEYPQVNGFHEVGLRQMACPGTSSWNSLFPRLANSRVNIRNFVAAGRRVGAVGVLNTDWGDHGHPNPLGESWYGYAYGAAEGWAPGALSDDDFERRFTQIQFGPVECGAVLTAIRALSEACTLPGIMRRNGSRSIELLMGDPITDPNCLAIPDQSLDRMRELAEQACAGLAPLYGAAIWGETPRKEARATLAEYRLSAALISHAARRAQAGRRLAAASTDEERHALTITLKALKRELQDLRYEYQRTWLDRSRPEGIWQTLDGFDCSAQVLDSWLEQVNPAYTFGS
ncbi:MAG TPA: family 20 glycosylhydrolase [Chloroflexota bacterium]